MRKIIIALITALVLTFGVVGVSSSPVQAASNTNCMKISNTAQMDDQICFTMSYSKSGGTYTLNSVSAECGSSRNVSDHFGFDGLAGNTLNVVNGAGNVIWQTSDNNVGSGCQRTWNIGIKAKTNGMTAHYYGTAKVNVSPDKSFNLYAYA